MKNANNKLELMTYRIFILAQACTILFLLISLIDTTTKDKKDYSSPSNRKITDPEPNKTKNSKIHTQKDSYDNCSGNCCLATIYKGNTTLFPKGEISRQLIFKILGTSVGGSLKDYNKSYGVRNIYYSIPYIRLPKDYINETLPLNHSIIAFFTDDGMIDIIASISHPKVTP